jgi:hypothetical protein
LTLNAEDELEAATVRNAEACILVGHTEMEMFSIRHAILPSPPQLPEDSLGVEALVRLFHVKWQSRQIWKPQPIVKP